MKKKYSSRQITKFNEERSRLILSYVYPDKYNNAVLGESPDIQNVGTSIGVEVTSGIRPDIQEGMSRATSIIGKTDAELTKHDKTNIAKNRVTASQMPNGMYIAGTVAYWGNNFAYRACIEKKYRLLNSAKFQHYAENNLFINVWMADQEDIDEAIEYICSGSWIDHESCYCFDYIFIFDGHTLIEIDVQSRQKKCTKIPDEYVHAASKAAANTIMSL